MIVLVILLAIFVGIPLVVYYSFPIFHKAWRVKLVPQENGYRSSGPMVDVCLVKRFTIGEYTSHRTLVETVSATDAEAIQAAIAKANTIITHMS